MNITAEWISALANVIVAGSIFFLAIQTRATIETLRELRKQAADDHDRSRRQNAVELLKNWNDGVAGGEPSARYIVEKFSPEQCQALVNMTPFHVPADRLRNLRNAMLEVKDFAVPTVEDKGILLSEDCLCWVQVRDRAQRVGWQCSSPRN